MATGRTLSLDENLHVVNRNLPWFGLAVVLFSSDGTSDLMAQGDESIRYSYDAIGLGNRTRATNQPRFTSPAVFGLHPAVAFPGERVNVFARNLHPGDPGVTTTLAGAAADVVSVSTRVITIELPMDATTGEVLLSVPDPASPGETQTFSAGTLRVLDGDADGYCIPYPWELALGYDPNNADSDGNGVSDGDEDADGDGLSNCDELARGLNLLDGDSDGDGLGDAEEIARGVDPLNPDSDADGIVDGEEVEFGFDPGDPESVPIDLSGVKEVTGAAFSVLDVVVPQIGSAGVTEVIAAPFSVLSAVVPMAPGPAEVTAAPFSVLNTTVPDAGAVAEVMGPIFSVEAVDGEN